MIKINLATRTQGNVTVPAGTSLTGTLSATKSAFKFDHRLDGIRDLPLRRYGVVIASAIVANWFAGDYKDQQVKLLQADIERLQIEGRKLKDDLAKTKGYKPLKDQLDKDEAVIRNKIKTVQTLIADRATPPKLFAALSTSTPDTVWLSQVIIKGSDVNIEGFAEDLNNVPDFFKAMNESAYFSDVKLDESKAAKEPSGDEVASFKIAAKRRITN